MDGAVHSTQAPMIEHSGANSGSVDHLLLMFDKKAREKAILTESLVEFMDWLAQQVADIESHVKRTLLRRQADALAYAMRNADGLMHRYKSIEKHVAVNPRNSSEAVVAATAKFSKVKTASLDVAECKKNSKKMVNRCKKSIQDAAKQLKLAAIKACNCLTETQNIRTFAKSLVETSSGYEEINLELPSSDFAAAYGLGKGTGSFDKDVLWHKQTGRLILTGNNTATDALEETIRVKSYGKFCRFPVDVCLVENLGFVVFFVHVYYRNTDDIAEEPRPFYTTQPFSLLLSIRVFHQSSGVLLCKKPVIWSEDAIPSNEKNVYCKLVRSGCDRFALFDFKSSTYLEMGLDRSLEQQTPNDLRLILLRQFSVCNKKYRRAVNFDLNSRVQHAVAVYQFYAVILTTAPGIRCRASFTFDKSSQFQDSTTFNCAISNNELCIVSVKKLRSDCKVSIFDLNGIPLVSCSKQLAKRFHFGNLLFQNSSSKQELALFFYDEKVKRLESLRLRSLLKPAENVDLSLKSSRVDSVDASVSSRVKCFLRKISHESTYLAKTQLQFLGLIADTCCFLCADKHESTIRTVDLKFSGNSKAPDFSKITELLKLGLHRLEVVTASCSLNARWTVLVINNALVATIDLPSSRRVNNVRFRLDESDEDAIAIATEPTKLFVARKNSGTIEELQCEKAVFNWRVTRRFVFSERYSIVDVQFDRRSLRFAVAVKTDGDQCHLWVLSTGFETLIRHQLDFIPVSCFLFKTLVVFCSFSDSRSHVDVRLYDLECLKLIDSSAFDFGKFHSVMFMPCISKKANKFKLTLLFYGDQVDYYSLGRLQFNHLTYYFPSVTDLVNLRR